MYATPPALLVVIYSCAATRSGENFADGSRPGEYDAAANNFLAPTAETTLDSKAPDVQIHVSEEKKNEHPIPDTVHFVYALQKQTQPLAFVNYIAILSAYVINQPKAIVLHYHYDMHGPWFERLKADVPCLTLEKIAIPEFIGAKHVTRTAHKADAVRMQVMKEEGGVYFDMDTISARPYHELLQNHAVMGRQAIRKDWGLCNAIMLASPHSEFFHKWWAEYPRVFQPNGWDEASVHLPRRIAEENPGTIRVLGENAFFRPSYDETHKIFQDVSHGIPPELITLHFWESNSASYIKDIKGWEWADTHPHTLYAQLLKHLQAKIKGSTAKGTELSQI